MPSSNDPTAAPAAAALVEKIEELSLLRMLNDRLASTGAFATACRVLVDLVWEERRAERVVYLSVDAGRGVCRLEAAAPPLPAGMDRPELALDEPPLPTLLGATEPVVLDAPAWLTGGVLPARGVVVSAPTRVRDTTTGLLVAYYCRGGVASLEEDGRLLAIVAASAALALDAARTQVREEFLATLRHDINNPLQVAIGNAEMIADRLQATGDTATLARVASVVESLEVVADLVSNYLSMAVIDRGVPLLEYQTFDLCGLATEIADRFRPAAADKRVTLTCGGPPTRVRGDARQLGRVLTNLVSNAVKYTPGPGAITVRVDPEPDAVVVEVTDTGYGIAPADLPTLGTKYTRCHRDKDIPGTGLGLYISRAIVDAHGGTLVTASTPGQGSTFTVRLPHPRA